MKILSSSIYRMYRLSGLLIICLILLSAHCQADGRDFYQIKIYTIENEQQGLRMDKFLKDAYLPALNRAGIEKVGVLKPISGEEMAGKLIYVLIPFKSIDQFEKLEYVLHQDKRFQKAGGDYINAAHDDTPYKRIESIILRSFKSFPEHGVPEHSTPASDRVYELRSYQGATEKFYEKKVEMFNEGQEVQLFIDLDFQPMFFGEVISGKNMPNLMYMITFKNGESQKKHWDTFVNSDEWKKLKGDPQYANTVSHIDKVNLYPTEYSGL